VGAEEPGACARVGVKAGLVAALLSGAPSTIHGLVTGRPFEPTLAAGSMLLPRERRPAVLALAAVPVHLTLSLGWGLTLSCLLPRRRTVLWGLAAGAGIAALDLGGFGRFFPRVAALPMAPQVADHLAFGAVAAAVIRRQRERR